MKFLAPHHRLFSFAFCFVLLSTTVTAKTALASTEDQCLKQATSITEKLDCIEGLTYVEENGTSGYRKFTMQFTQPTDHENHHLGTFSQKLILFHKSETAPMVLQTTGYHIYAVRLTSLAITFGANQIQVEHRFFDTSKPSPLDWSKLNIKQSADDFHRVTKTFKKIYPKAWVNTGASKGGMTSVYHRYFYPNDLDGTLADVAPLSFSTSDERYKTFVATVGGEDYEECRQNLKALQISLLENRETYNDLLGLPGANYQHLGGAQVAFEHSVIEMPFYFWQYQNPDEACPAIPLHGTAMQKFYFLQEIASISDFSDTSINTFMPYFYQAATQLGSPANITEHLKDLMQYTNSIDQYTPHNVSYTYSNEEMKKVEEWIKTKADKIMFIYGTFDPWTAGEFPLSESGKDVFKFYVPKANHSANFTKLVGADRSEAIHHLEEWFGTNATALKKDFSEPTLEDLEFEYRKKHRLR